MTEAQRKALQNICDRYGVEFSESDYYTMFDLPPGYVTGWVGGKDHGFAGPGKRTIYIGCAPDGSISS